MLANLLFTYIIPLLICAFFLFFFNRKNKVIFFAKIFNSSFLAISTYTFALAICTNAFMIEDLFDEFIDLPSLVLSRALMFILYYILIPFDFFFCLYLILKKKTPAQ
jgi:hypothetical protein